MFEDYLTYLLAEKRYSPLTVRAYGDDIRQFALFCLRAGDPETGSAEDSGGEGAAETPLAGPRLVGPLPEGFDPTGVFDYVKLGPYIAARGPLDDPATNQRLWRIRPDGRREDLTPRFWRKRG